LDLNSYTGFWIDVIRGLINIPYRFFCLLLVVDDTEDDDLVDIP
jgi:hypothetical protein